MTCNQCREIVSAGLDGEAGTDETAAAAEHLRRCAACRTFAERAGALHRHTRLASAPAVPDLGARILGAIGEETTRHARRFDPLRVVLAVVAALEIGAALPALLLGDDAHLPAHAARHAGSFALALGVGFLWAAWRPRRAAGVLVVAAALVACGVLASILDVATGRAAALSEVQHVPELVGLLALWLLQRGPSLDERAGLA